MKTPKLYPKKDGKYYFTFKGKQYYGGQSLEKAQAKLREVTGLAPSGDTDLVALVGQYLDSLVGTQSPDTIYGKAGTYKRIALSATEAVTFPPFCFIPPRVSRVVHGRGSK